MRQTYLVLLALMVFTGTLMLGPGPDAVEHDPPATATTVASESATAATTGSTAQMGATPTTATTSTTATALILATTTTSAAAPPPIVQATTSTTEAQAPASTTTSLPAGTTVYRPDGVTIRPSYRVVQAAGTIHVLDAPGGTLIKTLELKNEMGEVTTLLVIEPDGAVGPTGESGVVTEQGRSWYRVGLRMRPNGSTGWVAADEVVESSVTTSVVIELAEHRLTLYDGGTKVASYPVGLGTAANPTPTGTFFVMGVDKHAPTSAYGPFAIGTSGLSETLTDWPGGGMVGIHGTNKPSSVGANVSHGCVRMHNENIVRLAPAVSLGTPVFIVP